MATSFRIRQREDGYWVPNHPEVGEVGLFSTDGQPDLPISVIREALFGIVDRLLPGAYTLDLNLEDVRQQCFAKIDARSRALIVEGFTHQTILFSLSIEAQMRYTAMLATAPMLEYPLSINSLDDTQSLELASASDVAAFCGAALSHVRNVVDSGTVQKDIVRSTDNAEALLEFDDPR